MRDSVVQGKENRRHRKKGVLTRKEGEKEPGKKREKQICGMREVPERRQSTHICGQKCIIT